MAETDMDAWLEEMRAWQRKGKKKKEKKRKEKTTASQEVTRDLSGREKAQLRED
jgi:hypothetical protein